MAPIAISTANGGCIYAVGKGRLKTESNIKVNDVWHVPELSVSLASLSLMIDKGLRFNLSKDNMRVPLYILRYALINLNQLPMNIQMFQGLCVPDAQFLNFCWVRVGMNEDQFNYKYN